MKRRSGKIGIGLLSLAVILTIPLVFFARAALAIEHTFTSIKPPDEVGGYAKGINDAGQIVGLYGSQSGAQLGYLYDTRTSTTTIYNLFGTGNQFSIDYTRLTGINNSGQMVGEQYNGNTQYAYGLVITGNAYATFSVPGYTFTFANGINNLGQVIGWADNGNGFANRGFLYSGGNLTYIQIPVPSAGTSFTGINDNGQIVGGGTFSNNITRGFLWSGNTINFLDAPGAIQTLAAGINNLGQIVGSYDDSTGRGHGFLRDTDGTFTTIDWPGPNTINTQADGINNLGQIVGSYMDSTCVHAFLATPVSQPPTAKCHDVTVAAGSTCTASASIDNGSYGPNGVNVTQAPAGPYPLGTTPVTLTVTDSKNPSSQSQCTGTVTVADKTPPSVTAPAAVSAYTGPGSTSCGTVVSDVTLGTATASDNCPVVTVTRSGVPSSNFFPVGTTTITYMAKDMAGNTKISTQAVTVTDNSPPSITGVSASPSLLWPPNHKMVDVTVNYTSTDNCNQPACMIKGVTSNEPISSSDCSIVDPHRVKLSADRLGSGNGRMYTIAIGCTDTAGNLSTQKMAVSVPHDQGKN